MKKFYLFLLLCLIGPESLQAQVTDSMRYKLDQVFAPLDKSQVPTGLLDGYALPLAPLAPFNGALADSTRLTPTLFRCLYGTAYTACIYGANPLTTLQNLNIRTAAAEAAAGPATIPVMVQRIDYATVRPDAFSQNLLRIQNRQVYDVAGRSASPYLTRTLFAAAPVREFAATGDVSLVFQQSLYLKFEGAASSSGFSLQTMALNFGDGRGYLNAAWGQPLGATYSTAGTKRILVRFTYQKPPIIRGGKTTYAYYESQFDLFVAAPAAGTTANRGSDLPDVYFAAQPGQAAGTMSTHLAAGHTALTKPLIVVEGYDRSFVAPHTARNYGKADFLTDINTSRDGSAFDFLSKLEDVGSYDIVFIDFANGTDDILLNTGLFERVVKYVNDNKASAPRYQNVVLGMSMGGLIARYGLADMTRNANNAYGLPDTRLLLLQDSPQRGANLPLGLSALLRQSKQNLGPFLTSDISQVLDEANTLLDQPATKQLILYQTAVNAGGNITFAGNTFIEGPYRNMVAYQAPYRIVAASEGSQCGVGLFAPYTPLIRGQGYLNIFNWPFIFVGTTGLYGEVAVNALPAGGQASQVSRLRVFWQSQVFFGLITVRSNAFPIQEFSCPAGLLPVDGGAGGTEPIGSAIGAASGAVAGNATQAGVFYFPFTGSFKLVDNFCFIPTPSGLDINDFTPTTLAGQYTNGAASTSYSRTDGFIAQEQTSQAGGTAYNLLHLTYTPRNSEWLYNQMENPGNAAAVACTSECLPVITGPSQVCAAAAAVFQLGGANVTWTATPSNFFTVTSGSGSQFSTAGASGAQGTGTITATLPCGLAVTKTVQAGSAIPTGTYRYNGGVYTLQGTNFLPYNTNLTIFMDGPNNYTFSCNNPGVVLSATNNNSTTFYIPASVQTQVKITITAPGATCGLRGDYIFAGTYTPQSFTYSPNPANTDLTVTDVSADPEDSTSEPFDAELYDTFGKKVKARKSAKHKAVLDVRDLPNGLYNLRAGKGAKAISEHVQVTH